MAACPLCAFRFDVSNNIEDLIYLCLFARWEHRPSTKERHRFLSVAISISLLVNPISFVSFSVSPCQTLRIYLCHLAQMYLRALLHAHKRHLIGLFRRPKNVQEKNRNSCRSLILHRYILGYVCSSQSICI